MQMLDVTEDNQYTNTNSQNLFITTPTQFLSFESINLVLPQLKFTLHSLSCNLQNCRDNNLQYIIWDIVWDYFCVKSVSK